MTLVQTQQSRQTPKALAVLIDKCFHFLSKLSANSRKK